MAQPRSLNRTIVFHNGAVVLPNRTIEDGAVACRHGRITAVGRKEDLALPKDSVLVDARKGFITPGFVDIHVHGGDGADFMDGNAQHLC